MICCKEIETFLNDPRDSIEYNPIFREYFIRLNNCSNIITLAYCPWCGNKLPASLREKYFDTLKKEHGIDTNLGEYKERSDIPADFKSDKWWKVRETNSFSSFDYFFLIKQIKKSEWELTNKEISRIEKKFQNY